MSLTVDPLTGREIILTEAFAYNGQYEVKAKGYRGVATQGVVTNLDFAVGEEDRYINGIHLILVNHHESDTLQFQVVDVDGVLAPPGTVLKEFGSSWNVDGNKCDQGKEVFNYVARILAGLYIRLIYTSNGGADVTVKLNTIMHKKIA